MNGGAGGARPHYYASRRAKRPGATHPLAGRAADVTKPGAGGGAGRGDSRRFSRGRGGFSGSAQTLRRPDPSRASPRPGRTRSREVSSGPRRRHQASGRAPRMLRRGAGGQAPSGRQRSEVETGNPQSGLAGGGPSVRVLRAVSWVTPRGVSTPPRPKALEGLMVL